MNWIDRTYTGQERLWKVFWLGYIAPLLPLIIVFGIFKEKSASLPSWVSVAFFILVFIYQTWVAVAMWRCAPNVNHRTFFFLGRVFAGFMGLMTLAAALQFIK